MYHLPHDAGKEYRGDFTDSTWEIVVNDEEIEWIRRPKEPGSHTQPSWLIPVRERTGVLF